ncbi:MAG TPA: SAM-dependent chlorinase/fluorinase [bacterium]|nr:SAM-dependent chlorinase/fluorinase [bacterium]
MCPGKRQDKGVARSGMGLVTFLSDFGCRSSYPAAMKGAAAAAGAVAFVDISHDVPRHDVRAGAYLLWSAVPAFPRGTVHCAVVDPGVGTARAALVVAAGGQFLVGPDNGLLMPAARRLGAARVFRLIVPSYLRARISSTFHGRDVFAPAAARLAAGAAIERLARPVRDFVDLTFPVGRRRGRVLEGEIVWIDPFGNLITTIPGALLAGMGSPRRVAVEVGTRTLDAAAVRTFANVGRGHGLVFVGSDGVVEVAVNRGSAADATGAVSGQPVRIRPV